MLETDKQGARRSGNRYRLALSELTPVLLGVLAFSAVVNVLMLTGSIYMLQVYDRVLTSGSVPTLLVLFAIVVLLYMFLGFFDFLRARLLSRAALRLDQSIGAAAFQAWVAAGIEAGGAGSGAAGKTGSVHPLRDIDSLRGFLAGPTVTALFDVPFVPLYLGILFLLHPWLGWLTLAGAAITGGMALLNRTLTEQPVIVAAECDAAERHFSDKTHRGAEAILAMGMQSAILGRWRSLRDSTLATGQRGSDPSEMLAAASRAFRMLLQSAILTLGAYLVLKSEISGGMIIASSILSGRALAPVDQLIGQWRGLGRATAAHRRLTTFFATQTAQAAPIALPDPSGQISVSKLTRLGLAGRSGEQSRILSEISFALESGDGLGVIGNSACGKSTLARLLVGALRPDSGEIRFDSATSDQWDAAQLGRQIGYLPQVVTLLPGTVRDNIARFDPQAEDADVIAAARLTGVHEMILKLPDGYGTRLGGSDDVPLSGGQIQRLGLARAVFRMPKIVVLDEPNANLDVAGDDALTQTITALRQAGSSVIVMAHRPSALAAVNKLMILRAGAVAHFGDKLEILAQMTGQVPGQISGQVSGQTVAQMPAAPEAVGAGPQPIPATAHVAPLRPVAVAAKPRHIHFRPVETPPAAQTDSGTDVGPAPIRYSA